MAGVVLCVQNLPVPQDPRVWREARTLAAAGHRVVAVSPTPPGARPGRQVIDGIEVWRYRCPDRPGTVGLVLETVVALVCTSWILLRLRRLQPVDVVHVANPLDTLFLPALLLRRGGTRFVYDQHDLCPELLAARSGDRPLLRRVLLVLERLSYRLAHLVVVPNGSYREVARTRGGKAPEDVVIVRNGPDAVAAERPDPAGSPPVVAFAGVMGRQDGVATLVHAVADILARRPGGVVLELIGRGSEVPALRAEVRRLGIESQVRWAGWLAPAEMHERLAAATIGASVDEDNPFTRRSTMIKVTEYLALGLPCVVSDLGENRVTAQDAALYFRPGDHLDLAKRIEELLDDGDLRAELARRGRERAHDLLWSHGAEALVGAYATMLDRR